MRAICDQPFAVPPRSFPVSCAGLLAVSLLIGAVPLAGQPLPGDLPPQPPPAPPSEPRPVEECEAEVAFRDRTAAARLVRHISTFGHATVDVDNDGDDDLVIGNHGRLPSLYLNQGGEFADHSHLLPLYEGRDRHGITAVDLDDDGDRDLLIAGGGGGAGSARGGMENQVLRNLLAETGDLGFEPVPDAGVSFLRWRGRHLLPLPSGDGRRVDLYLLAKEREGKGNLYLGKRGGGIRYARREVPGLGPDFFSEGLDVPLDFDRDGRVDLLLIQDQTPVLLANRGGRYEPVETAFDTLGRVTAAAAGDLDRDGYPEIYLGTHAPLDLSDQVLWDEGEVHFVTYGQRAGDSDWLSFAAAGDRLEVDLAWARGLSADVVDSVFVGRDGGHPASRVFTVTTAWATGKPRLAGPGVYLWYQASSRRWHLEVRYPETGEFETGRIYAPSIRDVRTAGLEVFETQPTRDRIYRNLGGSGFEEIEAVDLVHFRATRSVTMVDLDLNGWLDVVVLRGAHWGIENGQSLVLAGCGPGRFAKRPLPNRDSRLFSAGELTFGLLDDDLRPDLFLTNGWGPAPSNRGPYRLLVNDSPPAGDAVALELVGSRSNRDALGAQVEIVDGDGRLLGYRLLAYRGLAQDGHRLHFGLGDHQGPVFARIRWPSGVRQTTRALDRNRVRRIWEPRPAAVQAAAPVPEPPPAGAEEAGSAGGDRAPDVADEPGRHRSSPRKLKRAPDPRD